MAINPNDPRVQEYIKQEKEQLAADKAEATEKAKLQKSLQKKAYGLSPKATAAMEAPEKDQKRPVKYKRGGEVLTKNEVIAIKEGRKALKAQMKAQHIYNKDDFEVTAASMGLYFDKTRGIFGFLPGKLLGLLLLAGLALLLVIFIFSTVQYMRGHFTVHLTDDMLKKGFVLDNARDFPNPTTQLFATPANDLTCISINMIPDTVNDIDGEHNDIYFAHTFYVRNDGDEPVDYAWQLMINDETKDISRAVWVGVFEDDVLGVYAENNETTGEAEVLPAREDTTHGYSKVPIMQYASESQMEEITEVYGVKYYRIVPINFLNDEAVTGGKQKQVPSKGVHKYTVVIWIEGDDPDATNEIVDGHIGFEMRFKLEEEDDFGEDPASNMWLQDVWSALKFWDDDEGEK